MAKFYGVIGYALQSQTAPGVWTDEITEKTYRGDISLNQQRWQSADKANKDFNLDNAVSIVADEFAYENFGFMRYIVWGGRRWEIQSLAINRPRIVVQIGGLYNGG